MPKILATSDFHGGLLPPEQYECDVLLIGGDVCPMDNHRVEHQKDWLVTTFTDWLDRVAEYATSIVGIAGNHDFALEDLFLAESLPWIYLQDKVEHVHGLNIYGTPWVPNLPTWAFHSGMSSRTQIDFLDKIPQKVDILLSHGPMAGYGDKVKGGPNVGDQNMREAVRHIQPKAFVCGHIHEGRGWYRSPWIDGGVYNVAQVDEMYCFQGGPVEISLRGATC